MRRLDLEQNVLRMLIGGTGWGKIIANNVR